MHRSPLTLMLALTAFKDKAIDADKVTQITPDTTTRFAFQKDADGSYAQVEISNQTGPQRDGKVEIIDVLYFAADEIDVTEIDRALVVRLEKTDLTPDTIQAIGTALENYMDQNGCDQFATASIHDIGEGQELFGRWHTLVLTRDYNGKWSAKNLDYTSVAKSTDENYGILRDGKLVSTDGGSLVSTLLDNDRLQVMLDGGYQLDTKKAHLVRPPVGKAFAVVSANQQVVYDDTFQMVGINDGMSFTTMQAINVDGTPIQGKVNTVSGSGNTWDVRHGIPATKAGDLAQAYGAQA